MYQKYGIRRILKAGPACIYNNKCYFYVTMKRVFVFFALAPLLAVAQNKEKTALKVDSLKAVLDQPSHDSTHYKAWMEMGIVYQSIDPDSSIYFHERASLLAKKMNDDPLLGEAVRQQGWDNFLLRRGDKALDFYTKALEISEKCILKGGDVGFVFKSKKLKAVTLAAMAVINKDRGEFDAAIEKLNAALTINNQIAFVKGQVNNYGNLGLVYMAMSKPDKAIEHYEKGLKLAEENKLLLNQSVILGNMGLTYRSLSDHAKAIACYERALQIDRQLENRNGVIRHLTNIAGAYRMKGDFVKALEFQFKALKLAEEAGDKNGQSAILSGIGTVYSQQSEYKRAESYYRRSLALANELNNVYGAGEQLNNIGIVYMQEGDSSLEKGNREYAKNMFAIALENYSRAYDISLQARSLPGQATALGNMGVVYKQTGQYDKAIERELKAIEIYVAMGNKESESISKGNIGTFYTALKKYAVAEKYLKESLQIAQQISSLNQVKFVHQYLYQLYRAMGSSREALTHYELFIQYRDSLFNMENTRASMQQEMKFAFEKKAAADSVRTAEESKVIRAQLKQEATQRYALYGGLSLVALFAAFMVNRFKVTSRQKKIIEEQKGLVEEQKKAVEEKQKEILDSIHYAKRIQSVLMPSNSFVQKQIEKAKTGRS